MAYCLGDPLIESRDGRGNQGTPFFYTQDNFNTWPGHSRFNGMEAKRTRFPRLTNSWSAPVGP